MLVDFETRGLFVPLSGVIHVGAGTGGERFDYAKRGLDVLWFEPIPSVFKELQRNIADLPKQKAYQFLILDEDDKTYPFHVSTHGGGASSILDFSGHRDKFPSISYVDEVQVSSLTLNTFFKRHSLDPSKYQFLSLDMQGTELRGLRGRYGNPTLRQTCGGRGNGF